MYHASRSRLTRVGEDYRGNEALIKTGRIPEKISRCTSFIAIFIAQMTLIQNEITTKYA